mmetsp:Transcript_2229/g.5099  ORF Transcript_2229/g.5099 Transcript_2229/m.5099 type:complete len:98 (-) Transcript_2229:157-450(-)
MKTSNLVPEGAYNGVFCSTVAKTMAFVLMLTSSFDRDETEPEPETDQDELRRRLHNNYCKDGSEPSFGWILLAVIFDPWSDIDTEIQKTLQGQQQCI